ncbi:MAG TPA: hypothetical protein VGM56_12370 [Byssovorax sp.]|jgi:hypothetical protein
MQHVRTCRLPRTLALTALAACSIPPRATPFEVVLPRRAPPLVDAKVASTGGAFELLCRGRKPCALRSRRDAGVDASGARLRVLLVDLGAHFLDADKGTPPAPVDDIETSEHADVISPIAWGGAPACHALEYWLIAERAGAVASRELLAAFCNDGQGAAGVGQDTVTVGDRRVQIETSGGSAWRWGTSLDLDLAPLRARTLATEGSFTLGPNRESTKFDLGALRGDLTWTAPACGPDGAPREDTTERSYLSVFVPEVELDAATLGAMKRAELGACAATLDGSGDHGWAPWPRTSEPGRSLRAVLSTTHTLFVDVRGAPPPRDARLEIWTSSDAPSYMDACLALHPAPAPWLLRLADGRVTGGPRDVELLERTRRPGDVTRVVIHLPEKVAALTLAYSDGRAGKLSRAFASSSIDPADAASLGRPWRVPARLATCAVVGGRLEPVAKTLHGDADHPVAGDD